MGSCAASGDSQQIVFYSVIDISDAIYILLKLLNV